MTDAERIAELELLYERVKAERDQLLTEHCACERDAEGKALEPCEMHRPWKAKADLCDKLAGGLLLDLRRPEMIPDFLEEWKAIK